MPRLMIAACILSIGSVAHAQTPQQRAHFLRQQEIRRHNYAQQQAIDLLFGPRGIPALTRPSDPWNLYGRGYGFRGGGYRANINSSIGYSGVPPGAGSYSYPQRYGPYHRY